MKRNLAKINEISLINLTPRITKFQTLTLITNHRPHREKIINKQQ